VTKKSLIKTAVNKNKTKQQTYSTIFIANNITMHCTIKTSCSWAKWQNVQSKLCMACLVIMYRLSLTDHVTTGAIRCNPSTHKSSSLFICAIFSTTAIFWR